MIVSAIATMSASISHFTLTPNSAGRTSSAERKVDITRPAPRGSTQGRPVPAQDRDASKPDLVAVAHRLPDDPECLLRQRSQDQGSVLYSALSRKSLSAPDSAPQTSPLRPASCRTPA